MEYNQCVFSIAARLVYNIYFHPLASYPGPLYLAASDIPLAIFSLLGTSQYPLKEAHDRYGEIVRIAPGTLSYINPQAWTDIYGYKKNGGGRANLPKDPRYFNEMLLGKETITLASDEDAIPIRRSLNSAFSHRALLEQEPMMQAHIGRLMAQFEKHGAGEQQPVDVREWFTFSMFDINSDFGFGEDMGCVQSGVYHDWVKFVVNYFYAAVLLHQCHKFWPLNRLLALCIPSSIRKMQVNHNEASLKRVRKRMTTDTDRHDFMYYFLKQATKEQLPVKTIEAQATVVILAGSETSAVAQTAAVYHILTHQDIHEKLEQEVRSTFGNIEDINLQDVLNKLPYLDAVVQETLRIHTPVPNGFSRWVPDKNGMMICGKHVPQGTVVTINHYCSNTSASNFRDPMKFTPDRWMGDATYADDRRDVVQPFSVGPRNCPGKQFALYNIKLTLAHLLWRFNLKLGDGTENWTVGQRVYAGWVQPALPVLMEKRA
ncbi:putative cytochrome p450 monooxygenase protein [Eutypa lata UCREL1]|uniref:Putative cytochrome p450 monooxygenase protein n=1 Tax=Eutypa lata (strain UCR-EL1) TaxID=1287681 RepID=M7TLM9_EUTLA|nr:putative cytochrome p450 monooxygenase protein [Eutypa lata UCREL1]